MEANKAGKLLKNEEAVGDMICEVDLRGFSGIYSNLGNQKLILHSIPGLFFPEC